MRIKYLLISSTAFFSMLFGIKVYALEQIEYPVSQLGGCRDRQECFYYCEIPDNQDACKTFAISTMDVLGEIDKIKEYDITFPVEELDNCENLLKCKIYCETPENYRNCKEFGRERGFTKYKKDKELTDAALKDLGCTSFSECKSFCKEEQNMDKCMIFAEKHGNKNEYIEKKVALLKRAEEIFGCATFASCMEFCADPGNQDRCMQLAKEFGFEGSQ